MTRALYTRRARFGLVKPAANYPYSGFAPRSTPVEPTTESGWETYNAGSRLFLPAAINYVMDPSFSRLPQANGLVYGSAYYPTDATATVTCSITQEVIEGRLVNVQNFRIVGNAGVSLYPNFKFPLNAQHYDTGEVITQSLYIRVNEKVGSSAWNLRTYNQASTKYLAGTPLPLVATPMFRDATTGVISDTQVNVYTYCQLQCTGGFAAGGVMDVSTALLSVTDESILTPYFDGSYDDCAWTGTADASTSTRTVSALTLPVTLGSTGFTISGRFTPLWAANDGVAHNLLTLYAGADARATIYKHTDNKLYCTVTDGTDSASSATAALSFAANSTHTFVARCTWAGTVDLNLDGTDATQGDASAVAAQTIDSIAFGGDALSYVGPVTASGTREDDTWTAAIQADSGAAFGSLPLLWDTYMVSGDGLAPLSSDGRMWIKP